MAEFQSLVSFKNVLLAPLGRVLPELTPLAPPPTTELPTQASSIATRHDHHNIEIKTVSELGGASSQVETNIYLFVPRSFEIASMGKTDLQKDFRSRMRLALPFNGDQGAAALDSSLQTLSINLKRLEEAEKAGEPVGNLSHPLCETLLEATKDLCAIIAENLKHGAGEHTRQFFMSHTLLTTSEACIKGCQTLRERVNSIHSMIARVRAGLATDHQAPTAVLAIFDEYMSQLYVQYLGAIRSQLLKIGVPPVAESNPIYTQARRELEQTLDQYQECEARHRLKFGAPSPQVETDLERERRLVRMSHLKKFFQSKTFIDISRQPSAKRISESTAAAGTALAGIVAALVERFSRPEITDMAFQGLFVLSFGVIIYVLRDRLKDQMKARFHEKALKLLPEFEQQLMAKEKKIGSVKEWYHISAPQKLPDEIIALRKKSSATEMEARLPEDVFHCRKIQEVHAEALSATGALTRALHENTRVNFERYLKHMDDPFKELTDLDDNGRFLQSTSHRVYHFYLFVKTVAKPIENIAHLRRLVGTKEPGRICEQTLVYRIVLDKHGVVRLEDLRDEVLSQG